MSYGISPWARASAGIFNDAGEIDPWARASGGIWATVDVLIVFDGGSALVAEVSSLTAQAVADALRLCASPDPHTFNVTVEAKGRRLRIEAPTLTAAAVAVVLEAHALTPQIVAAPFSTTLTVEIEPHPEDLMATITSTNRFRTKQNDTRPMTVTLLEVDDSNPDAAPVPINLANIDAATLRCVYRPAGDGVEQQAPGAVLNASKGQIRINWNPGGPGAPGLYDGEIRWEDGEGKINTAPTRGAITIEVIEPFGEGTPDPDPCAC